MQNSDKGYRERQRKLINEKTLAVLEYRARNLDEKAKERFRRPAYSGTDMEVKEDEGNII